MALSLKTVARNCLSQSTPLSVLHNVFGFLFPPGQELSLKRQLELIQGPAINLNVILVANDDFDQAEWEATQFGLQGMREIYAAVNLGIRKLRWLGISSTDAGAYWQINSGPEAFNLTDDFSGPNGDYLDLFVVQSMTGGAGGWADVVGPCTKDDKDEMTGAVASLNGTNDQTRVVFAHEVGHHLGASQDDPDGHHPNSGNFMHASVNGEGSNTAVTNSQGNEMKSHCYVKDIC